MVQPQAFASANTTKVAFPLCAPLLVFRNVHDKVVPLISTVVGVSQSIRQILRDHAFVGVCAVSYPNAVLLAVKSGKLHGFVIGIIRIDNRGLVLIFFIFFQIDFRIAVDIRDHERH